MKPTEKQIEAVAKAIEGVCFGSRFNDWTKDHVPGKPIEIFTPHNTRVVARFPADVGEVEALRLYERRERAIAALKAMGFKWHR